MGSQLDSLLQQAQDTIKPQRETYLRMTGEFCRKWAPAGRLNEFVEDLAAVNGAAADFMVKAIAIRGTL